MRRIAFFKKQFPRLRLLIDLTDERGGFFKSEEGGVVSNTPDSPAATLLRDGAPDWRHLRFGSLGHAVEFTTAAEALQKALVSLDVWQDTVVLANEWAETFPDGTLTPQSYRMLASQANAEYADYYGLLKTTGWNVAVPDMDSPMADPAHKWGPAPFHYTDPYYSSMWKAFSKA